MKAVAAACTQKAAFVRFAVTQHAEQEHLRPEIALATSNRAKFHHSRAKVSYYRRELDHLSPYAFDLSDLFLYSLNNLTTKSVLVFTMTTG